jgi:hypothetical protein
MIILEVIYLTSLSTKSGVEVSYFVFGIDSVLPTWRYGGGSDDASLVDYNELIFQWSRRCRRLLRLIAMPGGSPHG